MKVQIFFAGEFTRILDKRWRGKAEGGNGSF